MSDYTPLPGDRSPYKTNIAGVPHADDWDDGDSHHAPITLGSGGDSALSLDGQELTLADVLTPTEHTAIGNGSPHHAPITLADGSSGSLIGQELDLTGLVEHPIILETLSILTISSGSCTVSKDYHIIAAESGTTDDLVTINGGVDRQVLAIQADAGDTITVKHGTGNVYLNGEADFDLSGDKSLLLFYDGTNWSDLGAGGSSGVLVDHDHSGDVGDGGTFDAANLTSGSASVGDVLTSDGVGGAAWEASAAGIDPYDLDPEANGVADPGTSGSYSRGDHVHTSGSGDGDMTKAVYDIDANGVIDIAAGGTGATTAQAAIDALTNVSAATNEHVLTKDTTTGSAIFKEAASGSGDSTYTDAYASRPAASNDGDLFFPNDSFYVQRDTGAAWASWGPIFPLTPLVNDDFAWVNQGDATVSVVNGGVYLEKPAATGQSLRIRKKAVPSTPYTIDVLMIPTRAPVQVAEWGIGWRQSSDGKLAVLMFQTSVTPNVTVYSGKFTNETTWSAVYPSATLALTSWNVPPIFWRIEDNATNRIISYSWDGIHFMPWHSIGRTDFLTADEVIFYVCPNHATNKIGLNILSWKEA